MRSDFLSAEELGYVVYQVTEKEHEDLLPVSAVGVFASDLREAGARHQGCSPHTLADPEAILERSLLGGHALRGTQGG